MIETILISISLVMIGIAAYIIYALINGISDLFATIAVILRDRDKK